MLAVIARARAEGVEIRRELFNSAELQALPALGGDIEQLGLLASAALFMPDGMLNPDLPRYLQEASALNALWLKVSLGHFSNNQPLETLRTLLIERGMTLVVENDQTNWRPCSASKRSAVAPDHADARWLALLDRCRPRPARR